jgi:hypothetical protein
MKKSNGFLLSAVFLLLGLVIGFLISPVKHGISFKNHCENQVLPNQDDDFHDDYSDDLKF